jgi:hypothetical protein
MSTCGHDGATFPCRGVLYCPRCAPYAWQKELHRGHADEPPGTHGNPPVPLYWMVEGTNYHGGQVIVARSQTGDAWGAMEPPADLIGPVQARAIAFALNALEQHNMLAMSSPLDENGGFNRWEVMEPVDYTRPTDYPEPQSCENGTCHHRECAQQRVAAKRAAIREGKPLIADHAFNPHPHFPDQCWYITSEHPQVMCSKLRAEHAR